MGGMVLETNISARLQQRRAVSGDPGRVMCESVCVCARAAEIMGAITEMNKLEAATKGAAVKA